MNAEHQALAALVRSMSAPDVGARLTALEARVTTLEAAVPMTIPQPEPPAHEVEPVVMERGKPKRSSNRTVGKKR